MATTTTPVIEPVVSITYNPDGIPGQAYRIYNAAFSRLPDASGLAYWTNILNSGKSLVEIATGFMQSPEFKTMYGANPTHDTFVTKAYNNVLHRPPEAAGKSFWVNDLTAGKINQAAVLAQISESAENKTAVLNASKTPVVSTPTTPVAPTKPTGLFLTGTVNNDTLVGGAQNDTLRGGKGIDSMDGGAGDDTFVIVGDVSGGGKVDTAYNTQVLGQPISQLNGQNLNEGQSGAAETIRGGDGIDTLYVVGTTDLSKDDDMDSSSPP